MSTKDDKKQEQRLLQAVKYLDGRGIQSGIFGGTNRLQSVKHPNRKPPAKGTPIALYGYIQHEGTKDGKIPPRRFLSGAVDRNAGRWNRMFEEGLGAVIKGTQTAESLLTTISQTEVIGAIQKLITELGVIDTGALRMAIRSKVIKGNPVD